MSETPVEQPEQQPVDLQTVIAELEKRYGIAYSKSGLPYRSPDHRIVQQAMEAAKSLAYAEALALLTKSDKWTGTARRLLREVEGRQHTAQSDVDSAHRSESKLRRYGLNYLP